MKAFTKYRKSLEKRRWEIWRPWLPSIIHFWYSMST